MAQLKHLEKQCEVCCTDNVAFLLCNFCKAKCCVICVQLNAIRPKCCNCHARSLDYAFMCDLCKRRSKIPAVEPWYPQVTALLKPLLCGLPMLQMENTSNLVVETKDPNLNAKTINPNPELVEQEEIRQYAMQFVIDSTTWGSLPLPDLQSLYE